MKVEIIKHFINKELNWECGYYLVNGTIVIQNGEHWGVIPHMYGRSIVECVYDITQEAKDAIKEALVRESEQRSFTEKEYNEYNDMLKRLSVETGVNILDTFEGGKHNESN